MSLRDACERNRRHRTGLAHDTHGGSAVQYVILVGCIALFALVAYRNFGGALVRVTHFEADRVRTLTPDCQGSGNCAGGAAGGAVRLAGSPGAGVQPTAVGPAASATPGGGGNGSAGSVAGPGGPQNGGAAGVGSPGGGGSGAGAGPQRREPRAPLHPHHSANAAWVRTCAPEPSARRSASFRASRRWDS